MPSLTVRLLVKELELVVAHAEAVSIVNVLPLYPLTFKLDAVRRTHVDDEILPVRELDERMLPRYVRVFDCEIARLLAAADDEPILIDGEYLAPVPDG